MRALIEKAVSKVEAIQPFIALAVMVARKAKKATLAIMMLGPLYLSGM